MALNRKGERAHGGLHGRAQPGGHHDGSAGGGTEERYRNREENDGQREEGPLCSKHVRARGGGGRGEERHDGGGEEAAPAQARAAVRLRGLHMGIFYGRERAEKRPRECSRQRGDGPSTRLPYSSTVAVQPGCTRVLASGSSTIAGPARTLPGRGARRGFGVTPTAASRTFTSSTGSSGAA